MDAWLISWMPAGRNFVDRVVTVLPSSYESGEVAKILDALFYVGTLNLEEMAHFRSAPEMKPQLHRSENSSGHIRFVVEFGSFSLEARLVRDLQVSAGADRCETISWEEQRHDGTWLPQSFRRTRTGSIRFDIE